LVGDGIGALLLEGVLARELALSDNVTTEIVGPGDLLVPSHVHDPGRLLRSAVRWTVIEPPTFALLSPAVAEALAAFPAVYMRLLGRVATRADRLSVAQAISQLNGVDRRLLTLFWHLAERWGRVTSAGVAVGVSLPHRVIAELVGARRPTVSTALSHLAASGELVRQVDGTWLLTGNPVGMPTEEAARIVRRRRRRFDPGHAATRVADAPVTGDVDVTGAPALPRTSRIGELHETLAALREDGARRRADLAALRGETADLMARLNRQRERRRAALDRGRD
jgi:CRP-like cAMP-binding protein